MVPDRLTDWTYEAIEALCSVGRPEGDRHDFKFNIAELHDATKICCAFANTRGGYVVVGVKEPEEGQVNFQILGLDPDTEISTKLNDKIKATPAIYISAPHIIHVPGGTSKLLYVFEVPESRFKPHLPTEMGKRFFYKRQGAACVQMSLEEIRSQMLSYEEKLEKLSLLLLELNHICRTLEQQVNWKEGSTGDMFTFGIIDRVVVEAYAFLKQDPNTIGALDMVKRFLTQLNVSQQKMLNTFASTTDVERRTTAHTAYHDLLERTAPGIYSYRDQIARSFKEKFNVIDPFQASLTSGS